MLSSLIGLYSIPFIKRIYPHRGKTSLTSIIINCMLISILSAALPILVRTLGKQNFFVNFLNFCIYRHYNFWFVEWIWKN